MVTVSDSAELASPIADVRDVVETYRLYGVLTSDWRDVLTAASDALDRLPQPTRSEARIPGLVPRLRQLAAAGLGRVTPFWTRSRHTFRVSYKRRESPAFPARTMSTGSSKSLAGLHRPDRDDPVNGHRSGRARRPGGLAHACAGLEDVIYHERDMAPEIERDEELVLDRRESLS